jgi:hypothetical protein
VDNTNFTAMAVQLKINTNKMGTLKIHIDEVELETSLQAKPVSDILEYVLNEYDNSKTIEVQPHHVRTCQSDAVSKLLKGLSFEYGRLHLAHNNTPIQN